MGEEEEAAPEMETVAITRAFKAAAAVMGFGCKLEIWIQRTMVQNQPKSEMSNHSLSHELGSEMSGASE